MGTTSDDLAFCSQQSRRAQEPIAATAAASTRVWVALEYPAMWGAKAVEQADLPAVARDTLRAWAELPGARIQLIRREGRTDGQPLKMFIGISDAHKPDLCSIEIPNYEALASIDLPSWLADLERGQTPTGTQRPDQPVILVCTHGKRDRCCAKWGVPVYQALKAHRDFDVWQTTHLGGHRFAATLLVLPQGICYGRLELEHIPGLAKAVGRGELFGLDQLRGRTCHDVWEQAAEHFVRERTGARGYHDVAVGATTAHGEHRSVLVEHANREYEVRIARRGQGRETNPSCDKPLKEIVAVELVEIVSSDR